MRVAMYVTIVLTDQDQLRPPHQRRQIASQGPTSVHRVSYEQMIVVTLAAPVVLETLLSVPETSSRHPAFARLSPVHSAHMLSMILLPCTHSVDGVGQHSVIIDAYLLVWVILQCHFTVSPLQFPSINQMFLSLPWYSEVKELIEGKTFASLCRPPRRCELLFYGAILHKHATLYYTSVKV